MTLQESHTKMQKHIIGLEKSKQFLESRGYIVAKTNSQKYHTELVAISQSGKKIIKIKTHAVSKNNGISYGENRVNIEADYVMVWIDMFDNDKEPQLVILTRNELLANLDFLVHVDRPNKIESVYFCNSKIYPKYLNREDELIGTGFDD